ncbi:PaaI family thioesterase [Cytobacillus firmus]|uniref:PaaI family thioesterase n=1 Tax=Cytobacillus firmus TaxID=1399 RepID=UPI002163323A|nr:PaaI family thioesterase [Cytobacillus firmus]MCS0671332.1 PaaI family thioesterase [Cytobacillus firmus]
MLTEKLKTLSSSPVWKHIGLELQYAVGGNSKVSMPVKEEFLQVFEKVHGGILATLLDATMASAINSVLEDHVFSVTAEMKIQYLRPATGRILIGKGEVIQNGKMITICKSEIFDEQDKLVAFATGTFVNKEKT